MDQDIKIMLFRIEKHLQALVTLKLISSEKYKNSEDYSMKRTDEKIKALAESYVNHYWGDPKKENEAMSKG